MARKSRKNQGDGGRIQAKRRFGQHFLTDSSVLEKISQTLASRPGERWLEIGPGAGALTQYLLDMDIDLTVVEIDETLAEKLHQRWPHLNIIRADILHLDLEALFEADGWCLVGNLPYNISTQVLMRLPRLRTRIEKALFMLQKEVAERLCAHPGNRQWGRLGVAMQHSFETASLFDVPATAFQPKPAVESCFVHLKPKSQIDPLDNEELFLWLVKVAFGQKRKMLGNCLKALRPALTGTLTQAALLAESGIDPQRRAEELSVSDFVRLANRLQADINEQQDNPDSNEKQGCDGGVQHIRKARKKSSIGDPHNTAGT